MSEAWRADDWDVRGFFEKLVAPMPRRIGLVAYVALLATATHWPHLRIEGPVPRTDLWIHLGAFGTLGALATLAGFFGPIRSWSNAGLAWLCAAAYAGLDEITQAIPALGRTAGWDDFGADVLGVTLGVAFVMVGGAALSRVGPCNRAVEPLPPAAQSITHGGP